MNTRFEETILSLLDTGAEHADILSQFQGVEKEDARTILRMIEGLEAVEGPRPSTQVLAKAIAKASVTQGNPIRSMIVEQRTNTFSAYIRSFITYCTMQKNIAIGAGGVLALALVIGTAGYFFSTTGQDIIIDDLAFNEETLEQDVADLDAFALDDMDVEADMATLADFSSTPFARSDDLDSIDTALNTAFEEFESDSSDIDSFQGGDDEVDQDLRTIS
ncbi:MAG: hypothetical protein COV60_01175 [Candidatus Magasanikbacteria bacterium CG11_big_fil_rev_8_21_14_0_20_43_7]|uniref:Uncharacterized protein n=1 Tax=Candidatus Magasanikbacteria bacterium CG11_big_fil_rev_8_21_14_0_20_43_7 TaxID=1974654 RepID=A0A2H0N590_9BACT|nr:MAG: hypothetical protein COV60_01175 [Candidatus Magasanikbacteria bacterium CG11_big_fil_rev_8_21_14_0_20_43_7]